MSAINRQESACTGRGSRREVSDAVGGLGYCGLAGGRLGSGRRPMGRLCDIHFHNVADRSVVGALSRAVGLDNDHIDKRRRARPVGVEPVGGIFRGMGLAGGDLVRNRRFPVRLDGEKDPGAPKHSRSRQRAHSAGRLARLFLDCDRCRERIGALAMTGILASAARRRVVRAGRVDRPLSSVRAAEARIEMEFSA
jgi:hypothetical protein